MRCIVGFMEGMPTHGNEGHSTISQMDVSPDEFLEAVVFRYSVTRRRDDGLSGFWGEFGRQGQRPWQVYEAQS